MITIKGLAGLLVQVGIPVAYSHFKTSQSTPAPKPPFMVYLEEDSFNFGADNKVWKKLLTYRIEVYTEDKDLVLEEKLETLLDDYGVYYETDELFIDSQDLYQRVYYITLSK